MLRRRPESEGDFARERVGRGLATLDYDRDGDLDLALASNRGPAELLENRGGAESGRSIGFLLVGGASNRDAVGAIVRIEGSGLPQVEERRIGGSYLAQHDPVVWFGLGGEETAGPARIVWPSRFEERLPPLAAGWVYRVRERQGVVGRRPAGFRSVPGRGGARSPGLSR